MDPHILLSLIVFLPAAGALALMLPVFPKDKPELVKLVSLFITIAVFLLTAWMAFGGGGAGKFDKGVA